MQPTSLSRFLRLSPSAPANLHRYTATLLAFAFVVLTAAGCASSAPSIDDSSIRRKLDLRLQMALGGQGLGEELGEYIRVIVRLTGTGTEEDREELGQYGAVGAIIGPVVTLTLKPERVVEVAALPRVKLIEFDARNVPMPTPPPPPNPATG
ncbi:MAG: hypothetical protein KAT18_06035 [Candidatus Latescibacteria bacterium]|nr:hypothetical protein [Candidatus Latescibacterota bacterium]